MADAYADLPGLSFALQFHAKARQQPRTLRIPYQSTTHHCFSAFAAH
jgi:hypothetical protein